MRIHVLAGLILAVTVPPRADAADTATVSGNGVTLTSISVQWPTNDRPFPDGPGVDVVNVNCTGCHSPNMVLTQPTLTPSAWQETVTKMRKVYKAPVADDAVPVIVGYLTVLPQQH
jgi:hypothetical protein